MQLRKEEGGELRTVELNFPSFPSFPRNDHHHSRMAPTPTPHFILRHHSAQINALTFSPSNHLLYSGDADGIVAVTDTKSRRALAVWKAHEDGVLGVEEWPGVGFLT